MDLEIDHASIVSDHLAFRSRSDTCTSSTQVAETSGVCRPAYILQTVKPTFNDSITEGFCKDSNTSADMAIA